MSRASTKKVVTKGIMRVSQGQCKIIARISAAVDMKNNSQYKPVDFFFTSMEIIFAKIGEEIY
jgi:hypothetical protein